MPVKDRTNGEIADTGKYIKSHFDISEHQHKQPFKQGKRVIVPTNGTDVNKLLESKGRYKLYLEYTVCPAAIRSIRELDSAGQNDGQIFIISLTSDYDKINSILSNTIFSNYPIYTVEGSKYSRIVMRRKVEFIQEFCKDCYAEYKDELQFARYILIDNGTAKVIFK